MPQPEGLPPGAHILWCRVTSVKPLLLKSLPSGQALLQPGVHKHWMVNGLQVALLIKSASICDICG